MNETWSTEDLCPLNTYMGVVLNRGFLKRVLQLALLALLSVVLISRSCDLPRQSVVDESIEWDQSREKVGETVAVRGPVVDTHYAREVDGRPTFLNIGNPYPDRDRFVVVIWEDERNRFPGPPERVFKNKRIQVHGRITLHEGVPQIVVDRPGDIRVIQ